MSTFQIQDTIGGIVARKPALSRVFEQQSIDYCCGGKKTVDEVCQKKGIDAHALLATFEASLLTSTEEPSVNPASMTLTELADHIVETHHAYLKTEFPRLDRMTEKVAAVHGDKNESLYAVRQIFLALVEELTSHMMKEERILFPMVRQMESTEPASAFHCGSVGNPIRQMELEHDIAGSALETLNELTGGYTPPEWACNTYRALLDGLAHLESDMHQHIHKENNVLFPRAIEMEKKN
ncbi:MAG: iron-sulfur cluster repair di-iron protein [bacterium]|nr:iron-sulfur cluster repair di-iron protein [bacterium]